MKVDFAGTVKHSGTFYEIKVKQVKKKTTLYVKCTKMSCKYISEHKEYL